MDCMYTISAQRDPPDPPTLHAQSSRSIASFAPSALRSSLVRTPLAGAAGCTSCSRSCQARAQKSGRSTERKKGRAPRGKVTGGSARTTLTIDGNGFEEGLARNSGLAGHRGRHSPVAARREATRTQPTKAAPRPVLAAPRRPESPVGPRAGALVSWTTYSYGCIL